MGLDYDRQIIFLSFDLIECQILSSTADFLTTTIKMFKALIPDEYWMAVST